VVSHCTNGLIVLPIVKFRAAREQTGGLKRLFKTGVRRTEQNAWQKSEGLFQGILSTRQFFGLLRLFLDFEQNGTDFGEIQSQSGDRDVYGRGVPKRSHGWTRIGADGSIEQGFATS
jgi:hypothetical protein